MKLKSGLVSIGVPTFNRPEQLRHCLDGLVKQTYPNLEIIISDNCSTLPEVALVAVEFCSRDNRITYFKQKSNIGAIKNFQYVLSRADGEYFMWAADDDYRDPIYVEELVGLLSNRDDCVLSFCDFCEVNEYGSRAIGYPQHGALLTKFSTGNRLVRLLRFFLQIESKGKANLIYGVVRRTAMSDFCFPRFTRQNYEYGVDMLFVFMLMCKGSVAISPKLLYKCTVGNQKSYAKRDIQTNSQKFTHLVLTFAEQLRYATRYIFLATGLTRFAVMVCLPLKVLDIFVRLFATPILAIVWRKTLRILAK